MTIFPLFCFFPFVLPCPVFFPLPFHGLSEGSLYIRFNFNHNLRGIRRLSIPSVLPELCAEDRSRVPLFGLAVGPKPCASHPAPDIQHNDWKEAVPHGVQAGREVRSRHSALRCCLGVGDAPDSRPTSGTVSLTCNRPSSSTRSMLSWLPSQTALPWLCPPNKG